MMRNLKEYSRADLIEIIDMYRKHGVLWKVNIKGHDNTLLRKQAYDELLTKFKQVDPTATRQTVIQKLHTLRNVWRRERKKVMECEANETVYVPRLWYYDLMLFLEDHESLIATRSRMHSSKPRRKMFLTKAKDETSDGSNSDVSFSSAEEMSSVTPFSEPATLFTTAQSSSRRGAAVNKLTSGRSDDVLGLIKADLTSPVVQLSRFEMIGRIWAHKLKELRHDQRIFAEKLISDVFFEAEMSNLRLGCCIMSGSNRSHFASLHQSAYGGGYHILPDTLHYSSGHSSSGSSSHLSPVDVHGNGEICIKSGYGNNVMDFS